MTDQLDVLLADGVIDEVLGRLKSGKEANISLVRRGAEVVAAKVYKDRSTRSFKNNAGYKEGRKVRNSRTQRAIDSGGRFGRDAAEQAWKSAEADALYKLVGTGVRVPEPVMFYEGVLLKALVCDAEGRPAPRLIDVAIERDAAIGVFADLVAQMISMLCCDLIHGDLSPYNILAAADGPTIIDFPQVVSAVHNSRAEYFFLRDFDNVVRFLAGFDPSLAAHTADGRAIWRAYVSRELTPQFVPPPPPPPRATRGPDRRSRPDDRGRAHDGQRPPRFGGGRPSPPRDGRPHQPQPRADNRPPQRSDGPAQRSGRPPSHASPPAPRTPAPSRRPPPPVAASRWSDDRAGNAAPARVGRRRRPKRRW
jgi:RIO kinase 1